MISITKSTQNKLTNQIQNFGILGIDLTKSSQQFPLRCSIALLNSFLFVLGFGAVDELNKV